VRPHAPGDNTSVLNWTKIILFQKENRRTIVQRRYKRKAFTPGESIKRRLLAAAAAAAATDSDAHFSSQDLPTHTAGSQEYAAAENSTQNASTISSKPAGNVNRKKRTLLERHNRRLTMSDNYGD
jgi:hypothetical protein